ncbi:hypothetical protein CALCODRAFT_510864 [Calocera cornea HHB12733]|uniref:DUF6532 domain-containing protein n=1 Tax=Calocera cornea HHB12733 TaxID=1353952 RepID=A0A165E8F5_9BASI|nr:hypothetical protein CALCODRAFT_510864 [Calocera cornea HHB12733]
MDTLQNNDIPSVPEKAMNKDTAALPGQVATPTTAQNTPEDPSGIMADPIGSTTPTETKLVESPPGQQPESDLVKPATEEHTAVTGLSAYSSTDPTPPVGTVAYFKLLSSKAQQALSTVPAKPPSGAIDLTEDEAKRPRCTTDGMEDERALKKRAANPQEETVAGSNSDIIVAFSHIIQKPVGFAKLLNGTVVVLYPAEHFSARSVQNADLVKLISKLPELGTTTGEDIATARPSTTMKAGPDIKIMSISPENAKAANHAVLPDFLKASTPEVSTKQHRSLQDLAIPLPQTLDQILLGADTSPVYRTMLAEAIESWTIQQAATELWPSRAQAVEWAAIAWKYAEKTVLSQMQITDAGHHSGKAAQKRKESIRRVASTDPALLRTLLLEKAEEYIMKFHSDVFIGQAEEIAQRINDLCTNYRFLYETADWSGPTGKVQGPFRSPTLIRVMSAVYEKGMTKHAGLLEQLPYPLIAAVSSAWSTGTKTAGDTLQTEFQLSYNEILKNLAKYEERRSDQFAAMRNHIFTKMKEVLSKQKQTSSDVDQEDGAYFLAFDDSEELPATATGNSLT